MTDSTNAIQELRKLGQSVWLDNVYRSLITSGDLQKLIDMGVTGLTSNPSIFQKAIAASEDYNESLVRHAESGKDAVGVFEALATEDIVAVADLLAPVYHRTGGADGFASLEVNPHLARDTQGTISEARRLYDLMGRPNVMIKVPATPEGIPAIRQLISDGINVNVTLIFSAKTYADVREAYISGLEAFSRSGGDPSTVSSVASFFISRVDTAVDAAIGEAVDAGNTILGSLISKAAISNARVAYQEFGRSFGEDRFVTLQEEGALVQRPLWASTSTKNPELSDVLYVEELIGPDTVNTLPDATLEAFLDHGTAQQTLDADIEDAADTLFAIDSAGIKMDDITDKLLKDGLKLFADSYDEVVADVDRKRASLVRG
ncbi:MAG: transaldolase [SAR202 cluster bacterium]|nr:transaldolase [SAR202 cluster bacterium]MDP6713483.1 transaldolase [SAR202 cluster bacterium]